MFFEDALAKALRIKAGGFAFIFSTIRWSLFYMAKSLMKYHPLDYEANYKPKITDSEILQFVEFVPKNIYPPFLTSHDEYEPTIMAILEQIQETINRWKMLKEPWIQKLNGRVMLTIGNVWRLSKEAKQPNFTFDEYCIIDRCWHSVPQIEIEKAYVSRWFRYSVWPHFFDFMQEPSFQYRIQVNATICYVICKLGLTAKLQTDADSSRIEKLKLLRRVCFYLAEHYEDWVREPEQGWNAIGKKLEEHFLDRDLMSVLRTKDSGKYIGFVSYLEALEQKENLQRIARESRNFLPMLNVIPQEMWGRDDLLKDEVLRQAPVLASFPNSALRWLRKAPWEVLCDLYDHKALSQTIEVLIKLNLGRKVPVKVQRRIIQWCWTLVQRAEVPPEFIRLCRLFAIYCLEIKDEKGSIVLKRFLRQRQEVNFVSDWFWADGLNRGLPDKNSTWASLKQRSDQWHEELRHAELASLKSLARWQSPIGETTIDEITVTPLTSQEKLSSEGVTMGHCVSSYALRCLRGYLVFSLTEPDGTRSTLGLRPYHNSWQLDQHYGPFNSPVSKAASKVASKVLRLCNNSVSHFHSVRP